MGGGKVGEVMAGLLNKSHWEVTTTYRVLPIDPKEVREFTLQLWDEHEELNAEVMQLKAHLEVADEIIRADSKTIRGLSKQVKWLTILIEKLKELHSLNTALLDTVISNESKM